MPTPIQRADCARYFYMLRYGGCYVDLDIESLKTLDPALQGMQVALAYMTDDTESELSIPNAFLASVPGHPFWMFVIKRILQNFASDTIAKDDAHRISGPIVLRQAMLEYQNTSSTGNLTILPPHTVYGVDYNWRGNSTMQHIFSACHAASNDFNATKCKAFFPDSYAITYWSGDITWMAEAKARQTIKEEGSGQRESVRTPAQRQDNAWLKWPSSSSNGRV